METRANHVWVGAVTLVLLVALAAFIIWLARMGEGRQHEYDIFFKQSVDGLAKGTAVSYAGVPAGQIKDIELWPKDPSFVRVRVTLDEKIPILQGTTATIQSGFTGVSNILLNGGVRGAPPIREPGPNGVPVIPTKAGGLGALLNSAPLLLERLTTLSERLTILLSDQNQASISNILANTDRLTSSLATASPQVERTLAELQITLRQASETLGTFEKVGNSANTLLGEDGQSLAAELRKTLRSAQGAVDELKGTLNDARPAARQLSDTTLPAADAALRDLRAATRSLRDVVEKVDEGGAGALVGGQKLPDYKP